MIRALAFLLVLGGVTAASAVELVVGDPGWLTWVMLVAGPIGMVAAVGELVDARRKAS